MRFTSQWLRTFIVGASGTAVALLWVWVAAAQTSGDIRWSSDLHLSKVADIANRMHDPELKGSQRLKLTNGAVTREVGNCEEYLNAVTAGFHPPTTYDEKMAGEFVYDCFALRDLQHAHPAISGSSYQWTADSLTQLPPVLVVGAHEVTDAAEQAGERGKSWQQFDPQLRVTKIEGEMLLAEDAGYLYSLEIVARADFNGDGVEDIAVYGTVMGKHGTWASAKYFIFSPTRAGKLLRQTQPQAPFRMKVQIPD